ncbi:MAG: copper oxidase, partial [Candidatus Sulfotelmatobacter sp.]
MRVSRCWVVIIFCSCCWSAAAAQCPARPASGTVVQDALSLYSTGGILNAGLTMGYSVDAAGYSHYCYKYQSAAGTVEAPTLRVNPGDQLVLNVVDGITPDGASSKSAMHQMSMTPAATTCGDGGTATLQSTNVHFHGLNVPPICHQDDVLDTLIQPGTAGFGYSIQIPTTEPPGLYW